MKYSKAVEKYGSQSAAAKALNIPQSTFNDRFRKEESFLQNGANEKGFPAEDVSSYWVKTDDASYLVRRPLAEKEEDNLIEKVRAAFVNLKPIQKLPEPKITSEELLTLYPIADAHVGMMAWGEETGSDYDTKIACQRIRDWMGEAVNASPPSKMAIVLGVGDLLHANDETNMTPQNKHVLDMDTRQTKTLMMTIDAIAASIEMAALKHEHVIVRILPGNHDRDAFKVIMFALNERYRENSRIEVDKAPNDFFVFRFGANMIAAHHGDKAKPERLVMGLADTHAVAWGSTTHRFLFTGHRHHEKSADIGGMRWEQLRAVTEKDAYATSNSYSARSELQAITYRKSGGEHCRFRVCA